MGSWHYLQDSGSNLNDAFGPACLSCGQPALQLQIHALDWRAIDGGRKAGELLKIACQRFLNSSPKKKVCDFLRFALQTKAHVSTICKGILHG